MKIVIEVGHGGKDSGAVGMNARYEKDDNLKLAVATADEFLRNGWEVILTRETDIYINNSIKCKIENEHSPDCCIAFHRNGSNNPQANGFEIWVHSKAGDAIVDWGNSICQDMRKIGYVIRGSGTRKGTSQSYDDYYWNSGTKSPSMLLEVGFISNEKDNVIFDKNLQFVAQSICKRTCEYRGVEYKKINPQTGENNDDNDVMYTVQVGTFKSKKNAENYLKSLNEDGYNGFIKEVKN